MEMNKRLGFNLRLHYVMHQLAMPLPLLLLVLIVPLLLLSFL